MRLPERGRVRARVDVERVRDVRRLELGVEPLVVDAEPRVAPADVEAEERRLPLLVAAEIADQVRADAAGSRGSDTVPVGSVGWKYPDHDSITLNSARWWRPRIIAP